MLINLSVFRHADVVKEIIGMVADGGGELGVHMYFLIVQMYLIKCSCTCIYFQTCRSDEKDHRHGSRWRWGIRSAYVLIDLPEVCPSSDTYCRI